MAKMKKANIHILVIEELTDLLHELNEINNLQGEVSVAHGEHLHARISKTIFYTAFAIEQASLFTDTPRDTNELVRAIIKFHDQDGYVDRGDLSYALLKALTHTERMRLAYSNELGVVVKTLLEIIQLCLTDTNYLIYGNKTKSV